MDREDDTDLLELPYEQHMDEFEDMDFNVFDDAVQHAKDQVGHDSYQVPVLDSTHAFREATSHGGINSTHSPSQPQVLCDEPLTGFFDETVLNEAMQYAYENNLVVDYLLNSFSIAHLFGPLVRSTIPMVDENGFTSHSHLATVEIPDPIVVDHTETLTITPSASKLIAEARYIPSEEEIQEVTEQVCRLIKAMPRKVELPILRTDNLWDMRVFQKRMLRLSCPDACLESIKEHKLPLDPQNIAEGEGMELSCKARAESQSMMKKAEEEKLSVTKASISYLYSQLKDDYALEDQMAYLIGEIKYEKTPEMEKITPPASPKLVKSFPAQSAFDPGDLPAPSDGSNSLLNDNFHAIEDMILGDHQDVWSANTSPIREMLEDSFAISPQHELLEWPRQATEDIKVEVPLMVNEAPHQVGPSGPDAFKVFIDAEMSLDLDPESERTVLHSIPDDDLDTLLQQAADNAMKSIEQEQLQAIDAVGRVPVPVMDFSILDPDWRRLGSSAKGILEWTRAGKEQLFVPPSWPRDRAAESKMIWGPLAPGAGKMPQDENMNEGAPLIKQFLDVALDKDILTSLNFVHLKDKAAVFNDDDQDEEVDPQFTRKKPMADLMGAVKKRLSNASAGQTPKRPRLALKKTSLSRRMDSDSRPALLPGDSPGASGKLLANFMEVHAPKKKVVAHSKYFASQQTGARYSPDRTEVPIGQVCHQALEKVKTSVKAPCPAIEPPAIALTVFISIKIHRRMLRVLEGLIPGLRLLERDYDAHNTFIWQPGSVGRTEVIPPLADDADITVSPSTGIIVTSTIRVRQKPRTNTEKTTIQVCIEKVSLRYERLIVLVGGDGGKNDNLEVMSASDSTALLELQGFASGLECSVQVHYVGGGDTTLTNWVASCICRYGLVDPAVSATLLEPETLWEVFLRRAGFNVFAAQAVASQFKPPDGGNDVTPSVQHGLGAFMIMTRDERMRRFGKLVGTTVLKRVSKAVDELWNQD
ncbi:unnamed protein product [Discula destructiva]